MNAKQKGKKKANFEIRLSQGNLRLVAFIHKMIHNNENEMTTSFPNKRGLINREIPRKSEI